MLRAILGAAAITGAAIIISSLISRDQVESGRPRLTLVKQQDHGIIEIPITEIDEMSAGETFLGVRIATEYTC
ncbi:MAG TPA: hypothetical protein VFC63_26785 [Blastocatellia bacterium]|nr:hypothetical protein [Blastocatellia bacterium]